MHTRFANSEEPHIWSEFTQKRTTRMHQFFSASSVLEIWLLVLSFILFGMNLTLCCTLHTYINTSSYQSFTELNEKDTNYELRTHISLSTLIPLRDSHI